MTTKPQQQQLTSFDVTIYLQRLLITLASPRASQKELDSSEEFLVANHEKAAYDHLITACELIETALEYKGNLKAWPSITEIGTTNKGGRR